MLGVRAEAAVKETEAGAGKVEVVVKSMEAAVKEMEAEAREEHGEEVVAKGMAAAVKEMVMEVEMVVHDHRHMKFPGSRSHACMWHQINVAHGHAYSRKPNLQRKECRCHTHLQVATPVAASARHGVVLRVFFAASIGHSA